ncbi:MAG: hypothetical protein ABH810_01080 [bacterium]
MKKKSDVTLDEVLEAVNNGFTGVQEQINDLKTDIFGLKTDVSGLKTDVGGLKHDMVWVKDTLEKHTTMLKRLDEERIFTLNYVKRLEKEIAFIKKHLKIA